MLEKLNLRRGLGQIKMQCFLRHENKKSKFPWLYVAALLVFYLLEPYFFDQKKV
jgi:hypothetical protein